MTRVEELGYDKDELLQKKKALENRKPTDPKKANAVRDLLNHFRRDIRHFIHGGGTKRYYDSSYRDKIKHDLMPDAASDDPLAEGNQRATQVINLIKKMRSLFKINPLDKNLPGLLQELESWMAINRCRCEKIVLPTEYPSGQCAEDWAQ